MFNESVFTAISFHLVASFAAPQTVRRLIHYAPLRFVIYTWG